MPYVNRDQGNKITAVWNLPQRDGHERVSANHPDLVAYKNAKLNRKKINDEKEAELKKINDEAMKVAIASLKAKGETFKHYG